MRDRFELGGELWTIQTVNPTSLLLVDRTNRQTLATTDPYTHHVYISTSLGGDVLRHVLAHELGHCIMVSYGMLDRLHQMTRPEYHILMEEWVCNFLADFSPMVQKILDDILGR